MSKRKKPHSKIRLELARLGKTTKLKKPDLTTLQEEDELRQLKWPHGVRRFPPKGTHVAKNKKFMTTALEIDKLSCFLWVAMKDRIKFIHEKANVARRLTLKKVKHTNLTGGEKAYSGGEMWIIAPKTIVINGCSGRYGPRTEEQLIEIVKVFTESGWCVKSLGWDSETCRPVRYPR